MTRTVLSAVIVMSVLIPGSLSGGLGMPTEEDATVSDIRTVRPHQTGQDLFRSALSELARVAVYGGGLPIKVDGAIVGAIGVSGETVQNDIDCAEAALAVIKR